MVFEGCQLQLLPSQTGTIYILLLKAQSILRYQCTQHNAYLCMITENHAHNVDLQ